MKLVLRNLAAEWLLEALTEGGEPGSRRLDALVTFARAADADGVAAELDADRAAILANASPFDRERSGIRLRSEFLGDLPALRARAERFAAAKAASDAVPRDTADSLEAPTLVAAVLFDRGLFFEVHEWLEPHWLRAEGETRTLLQGLIQVAVGFHHHQNGNLRAALSLLSEGNAKLFSHLPTALGLDLARVCSDVESFAIALRHRIAGESPPDELPYPRLALVPSAATG